MPNNTPDWSYISLTGPYRGKCCKTEWNERLSKKEKTKANSFKTSNFILREFPSDLIINPSLSHFTVIWYERKIIKSLAFFFIFPRYCRITLGVLRMLQFHRQCPNLYPTHLLKSDGVVSEGDKLYYLIPRILLMW